MSINALLIAAHGDNFVIGGSGTFAKWNKLSEKTKFTSIATGDVGSFTASGGELARLRKEEMIKCGDIIGTPSEVWNVHDCEIMYTLELRTKCLEEIRKFGADIVITSRGCEYNADCRTTGQLVTDACTMAILPNHAMLTPPLKKTPILLYKWDNVKHPVPFRADIVVSVDDVIEQIVDAAIAHESMAYEWIPKLTNNGEYAYYSSDACINSSYCYGEVADMSGSEKRDWYAKTQMYPFFENIANIYRKELIQKYGHKKGSAIKYAEAFEIALSCRIPTKDEIDKMFPF